MAARNLRWLFVQPHLTRPLPPPCKIAAVLKGSGARIAMPVANLKSQLAAAMRLFRVPADNPDLTRAQFDAFSKQIPLLYFILMSNTIAVAYTYVQRGAGLADA